MRSKLKLFLVMVVILFSGCTPPQPAPSRPTTPPTSQPATETAAPPAIPTATVPVTPVAVATVTAPAGTAVPAPSITSLQMVDANNGWAWTDYQHLLRTSDGGQTWIDRTPPGQIAPEGGSYLDAQTAWLSIVLENSQPMGLLHTTDGGQTWTQYPFSPGGGLHFTDAQHGWAEEAGVGAGNAYYNISETQDGGKTWQPVLDTPPQPEDGLPKGTIHLCNLCNDAFYYDPSRMIIVYGDMAAMQPEGSVRLLVSFDLGKTWQKQKLPLPKMDSGALVSPTRPVFFPNGEGFLPVHLFKTRSDGAYPYASQRLALYHTQDGGASWSVLPGVVDNVAPFAPLRILSEHDIFVLCGNALCASHDGAQTWQAVASNLDFTQSDTHAVQQMYFQDTSTGWVWVIDHETTTLYKTTDGGKTWTPVTPRISAGEPITVNVDTHIPTPTPVPTATLEPTPTPNVAFDPAANAYRIRFAPNATWMEVNGSINANATKRYVLSAMQGQIMSVSIPQGAAFSVSVAGADKKTLSNTQSPQFFWRGALPATQDYVITVQSQVTAPFTLRVVINPPGQATQTLGFADKKYLVGLSYTDEFAPVLTSSPAEFKGTPLLTLTFVDPAFYFPTTNLNEAYLTLTATDDPAVVATCTQPPADRAEKVTGEVRVNNYTFTRAEFTGAAAGNRYEQISYRTVFDNKCYEVIYLFHSGNIGNYTPGTVVEFDRAALLKQFDAVLDTFFAK